MDTHTEPEPVPLPTDVAQRIRDYRPRAMTADEWASCSAVVINLVSSAPPADPDDARDLLTSSVALIVWAEPKAGSRDLRLLLKGPWLERFAAEWRREERPDNSLRNHLARLHRLQRTAAGGDGARHIRRTDRTAKKTTPPYGEVECTALLTASGKAPPAIGTTIRKALALADQGIVVPLAYEHGLAEPDWQAARAWIKAHRLPALDALQLRRMWSLRATTGRSLVEALEQGVTRGELDGLRPHLPHGDTSVVREQLRSC